MSSRIPEQIFVSYSRKDQEWLERLRVQLAPLVQAGTVKLWCDKGEIEPGDAFNRSIAEAIDTSSAAVLLVSGDFQASEFIQANELPRLLRQADAGELRLFWVSVGHCVLADKLGETYHTVGNPSRPLEGCDRAEVNRVLTELARKLEQHVRELHQREEASLQAAARARGAEEQRRMEAERAEQVRLARVAQEARARRLKIYERMAREARAKTAQSDSKPLARWLGWGWKLAALLLVGLAVTKGREWLRGTEPALPAPAPKQVVETATRQVIREQEAEPEIVRPAPPIRPRVLGEPVPAPVPEPVPVAKPAPFTNSLGMKFVPVPGTDILMSIWETRVQDYAAFAALNSGVDTMWQGASYKDYKQEPNHPVVNVSWKDAQLFCLWLSKKEGKVYRLPTDHEWSLAVGIGDREDPKASPKEKSMRIEKEYPWGSQWPPPPGAGNYGGEESAMAAEVGKIDGYRDNHPFTAPVESYAPNKLGIFDLGGNVCEWCEDFYDAKSGSRVLRGASWYFINPDNLLSSCRDDFAADRIFNRYYGFRCVVVGGGER